jgi:type IV secretory pathway TraG/TraD family ATPase VirD4
MRSAISRSSALPISSSSGRPLYAPWKFFLWWYAYDAYARSIFETGALIFLAGVIISVATAFGFSLWRAREAKDSDTYGSARWATARDARKLSADQRRWRRSRRA